MPEEELELVKKAQDGDVSAFEKLIYKYDEKVLSIAFSMVGNYEDARDLYQEIFIRAFKALPNFKFKSSFYTWLYKIVVNQCINFRNKRKRKELLLQRENASGESYFDQLPSTEMTPEDNAINKELSFLIKNAVENLPPKQKMVFILRHFEGKKILEIAEIMRCTDGTVKNYLFRASEKMKKQLKEYRNI